MGDTEWKYAKYGSIVGATAGFLGAATINYFLNASYEDARSVFDENTGLGLTLKLAVPTLATLGGGFWGGFIGYVIGEYIHERRTRREENQKERQLMEQLERHSLEKAVGGK